MVEKFRTRLNLSPEQMQRLESVLDETQREFSQLHLAVKPRFEEIRQRMRLGIRQILNEEQKREYDVMIRDATSKGQEERWLVSAFDYSKSSLVGLPT